VRGLGSWAGLLYERGNQLWHSFAGSKQWPTTNRYIIARDVTDILIRSEGKNIFIAECKFWFGPKKLIETIDQLLGYSSWRDTKVAIIVFNRNKDFSKVLESIQETSKGHSNFKRKIAFTSETMFYYVFAHRDDPNRELLLTVMAFDVPANL